MKVHELARAVVARIADKKTYCAEHVWGVDADGVPFDPTSRTAKPAVRFGLLAAIYYTAHAHDAGPAMNYLINAIERDAICAGYSGLIEWAENAATQHADVIEMLQQAVVASAN